MPGAGGGASGPWGAEGPPAVRGFGRAFTRAIAPASDSDPIWGTVALGDAGKLEVAVHIDGSGHVTSAEPRGAQPPRALVSLVRRTLLLIQAGTFAVGGDSGGSTSIFELRAVVRAAAADGNDDQDVGKYEQGRGTAEFTQATGRHVAVTVKMLRVEPR